MLITYKSPLNSKPLVVLFRRECPVKWSCYPIKSPNLIICVKSVDGNSVWFLNGNCLWLYLDLTVAGLSRCLRASKVDWLSVEYMLTVAFFGNIGMLSFPATLWLGRSIFLSKCDNG